MSTEHGFERLVLGALAAAWAQDNEERFEGAMQPPVLALHEGMQRLGQWTPSSRQLSLSRALVTEQPWGAVLEVLRHEMAHQYVHEVRRVQDESSHGPVFRAVCAARGIDARAAGMVRGEADGEPIVLRRVRKLLARADGPDTGEARTASRLAWRLMARHGIGRAEVVGEAPVSVRQVGPVATRHPKWRGLLVGVLTSHWQVQATRVPGFDVRGMRQGSTYEVAGSPEAVEVAVWVHDWFTDAAERSWARHRRQARVSGASAKHRYLEGLVLGFRERLADEARVAEAEEGLVLVRDPAVDDFLARRYPHRRAGRRLKVQLDAQHAAGRQDGRALRFRKPIRATADRGGGLLTGPKGPR